MTSSHDQVDVLLVQQANALDHIEPGLWDTDPQSGEVLFRTEGCCHQSMINLRTAGHFSKWCVFVVCKEDLGEERWLGRVTMVGRWICFGMIDGMEVRYACRRCMLRPAACCKARTSAETQTQRSGTCTQQVLILFSLWIVIACHLVTPPTYKHTTFARAVLHPSAGLLVTNWHKRVTQG